MLDKMKYRLKQDQELLSLSLLVLISILAKIIALILWPPVQPIAIQLLNGLLSLSPFVVFLVFIALQYKTKENSCFKSTFIFYCCALGINSLMNILFGFGFSAATLLNVIVRSAFYICMLVFTIKGVKSRKSVKIVCVVQIVYTGFSILVDLIALFSAYSYLIQTQQFFNQFFSILLSGGATALFWIIVMKISPAVIKIKGNEKQSIQAVLEELKLGFENGLITEDEYSKKKAAILNKL